MVKNNKKIQDDYEESAWEDPEETCPYKGMKHGHCNVCGLLTTPEMKCKCEFRNPSQSIEEGLREEFVKIYFILFENTIPFEVDDISKTETENKILNEQAVKRAISKAEIVADWWLKKLSLARTEERKNTAKEMQFNAELYKNRMVAEYKAELIKKCQEVKENYRQTNGWEDALDAIHDIINFISPNKE